MISVLIIFRPVGYHNLEAWRAEAVTPDGVALANNFKDADIKRSHLKDWLLEMQRMRKACLIGVYDNLDEMVLAHVDLPEKIYLDDQNKLWYKVDNRKPIAI